MSHKGRVIKGISWIASIRVITRVLSLIKVIVIARFFSPDEIGLFSIAVLVLALVEILMESGVNVFLIQEKDGVDKYINTAWIVSIVRGFLIAFIIVLSAPFISIFFNTPNVVSLLLLISTVPVLRGFINPSVVKFQKELLFQKEFYYRTGTFLVEVLVTVFLVIYTQNLYSLIWGIVFGVLFEVFVSYLLITPHPKLSFEKQHFRTILHSGKWITASGLLQYANHNSDNIVIGKMLGAASLGLYEIVYKIAILPITEVGEILNKVTLPIYVRISSDAKRLRSSYLKSVLTVSALIIPLGVFVSLFPTFIIQVTVGEAWLPASPVLRVLALYAVIQSISETSVSYFYAQKKQDIVTKIRLSNMIGLGVAIIPFISLFGLVGAAYAQLVGSILSAITTIYFFISYRVRLND